MYRQLSSAVMWVGVVSPVTKPMLSRATDPHLYLGVVTVGFTLTWSPTFTDVSSLLTGDIHTQTHRPMTTSAKRAFRCSAPAVWNSLPTTALNRDSVIVLKSRLWYDIRCYFNMHSKADIPILPGFLFFLCSLTCCLALVPLKLRLHGAIQICLLLLFFKAHQHKFALTISATRQT